MISKLPRWLTTTSNYSVILFCLLFPVFYIPFTYDIFELSKSVLIVVFSLWFLILLGINSLLKKSFLVASSYLALPAVLLVIGYLISGVFSYSTTYTMWGVYGFLGNSLPVIMASILLVISVPSLIDDKYTVKKAFNALSLSMFIVVLTSAVALFKVIPPFRPFLFLSSLNSNLAGSFLYLQYFLPISAFVFTFNLLNVRRKALEVTYFVALLVTLLFSAVVLNAYFLVFTLVACAIPFLVSFKNLKEFKNKAYMGIVSVVLFVIVGLIFKIPSVTTSVGFINIIPATSSVSFSDSWSVTSRAFAQRPVFGYGPSTFLTVFAFYKPQALNNTIYWDTLFVKPFSFYMLLLSEVGLVGVAAFGFMLYKLVLSLFKNSKLKDDANFTGYAFNLKFLALFILFLLLTTSGNVVILGLLFIVLALSVSFEKFVPGSGVEEMKVSITGELSKKDTSSLISVVDKVFSIYKIYIVVLLVVLFFGLNFVYRVVAADALFLSYFKPATNLLELRDNYARAASVNPRNDFYQKSVINVDRSIVKAIGDSISKKTDLTEEQKKAAVDDISKVIKDAATRAEFITSDLGLSTNPQNWESKGLVYQSVLGVANNSDINALRAYNEALARNPLNPRLVASVGNVYYFQKKYQEAATAFYRAVQLKPNFAVARYNLAKSLEELKQYDNALTVAKSVLSIVDKDSSDYQLAEEYVTKLEGLVAQNKGESTTDEINLDQVPSTSETPNTDQKITEPGKPIEPAGVNTTQSVPTNSSALPNQEPVTTPGGGFVESPVPSATPVVTVTPTAAVSPVVRPTPTPSN